MRKVYEVKIEDRNGDPLTVRVKLDGYIPYRSATQWEPEQHEDVDWFFCDEKGKFIKPDFDISDWQIEMIDEHLLAEIGSYLDSRGEP